MYKSEASATSRYRISLNIDLLDFAEWVEKLISRAYIFERLLGNFPQCFIQVRHINDFGVFTTCDIHLSYCVGQVLVRFSAMRRSLLRCLCCSVFFCMRRSHLQFIAHELLPVHRDSVCESIRVVELDVRDASRPEAARISDQSDVSNPPALADWGLPG